MAWCARTWILVGAGVLAAGCAASRPEPLRPPERPAAELVRRAERLRRRGERGEARAEYLRAIRVDAEDRHAHVGLQELLEEEGRHLEARRRYREEGGPFLMGRLEVPGSRRQRESFEAAEEPWRSAGLGVAAIAAGNGRTAAEHLERAVALDPGHPWFRVARGRHLLDGKALGAAESEFLAARWADPAHPLPPLGLSAIADRRGHLDEAFTWAVEAYRCAPANNGLAERVFDLAWRSGRRDTIRAAAELLESRGRIGDGFALMLAGRLLGRAGERERARAAFERSAALGVSEAEIEAASPAAPAAGMRAFVRAFVRGVQGRYRHFAATGEAEDFDDFVAWARDLFRRTTGRPLGPAGRPIDYAFVGKLMDPTERTDEPLVRVCAEAGMVLVLGQRRGGPPEALLADVVRREPMAKTRIRGTVIEREVVWTGRRYVSGYLEWAGAGDLAGVALERMVLVDLHAVARWEGDVRRRIRHVGPHRERVLAEPALADRTVTDVDDPAGVAERLYLTAPLDIAGEVRVHEDAHLVDAKRHLPVGRHPLRNLGLALRRGFSASEILSFLERNAQLAAIAEGPSPRGALATCCAVLEEQGVHAAGYREIVQGMVDRIAREPEAYPQIDTTRVIVQQLHRLEDEQVRELARALLRQ